MSTPIIPNNINNNNIPINLDPSPNNIVPYPVTSDGYQVIQEIGSGAFASVYKGLVKATKEFVAIKVLDLDSFDLNADEIRREIQIMSLLNHPNVVKIKCSFVDGHSLWIVMDLLEAGSCASIMKSVFPNGIKDEAALATILKEVACGLQYFHKDGRIHRDLKAGNILMSSSGNIQIADFGVAGTLVENGDRKKKRQTFTGTPCWMAPEVMEHTSGYDTKADIWSFGITALELAYGRAPYAQYPPMRVILLTLSEDPPCCELYDDNSYQFSKHFKSLVKKCLQKESSKRPSAKELLSSKFFKQALNAAYLKEKIVAPVLAKTNYLNTAQNPDDQPEIDLRGMKKSRSSVGFGPWVFDEEEYEQVKRQSISDRQIIKQRNCNNNFDDDDDDDDLLENELNYQTNNYIIEENEHSSHTPRQMDENERNDFFNSGAATPIMMESNQDNALPSDSIDTNTIPNQTSQTLNQANSGSADILTGEMFDTANIQFQNEALNTMYKIDNNPSPNVGSDNNLFPDLLGSNNANSKSLGLGLQKENIPSSLPLKDNLTSTNPTPNALDHGMASFFNSKNNDNLTTSIDNDHIEHRKTNSKNLNNNNNNSNIDVESFSFAPPTLRILSMETVTINNNNNIPLSSHTNPSNSTSPGPHNLNQQGTDLTESLTRTLTGTIPLSTPLAITGSGSGSGSASGSIAGSVSGPIMSPSIIGPSALRSDNPFAAILNSISSPSVPNVNNQASNESESAKLVANDSGSSFVGRFEIKDVPHNS